MALIDLKFCTVELTDGSTPPNRLTVNLGTGNLEYTEHRTIEFVKRRGELDTAREGEEVPLEVAFQFAWERLTASQPGDPPTVEDVLRRRGPAAGWASASPDAEAPYCVDVLVTCYSGDPTAPGCTEVHTVLLEELHFEELAHAMADAAVDVKGKCNRVKAGVA